MFGNFQAFVLPFIISEGGTLLQDTVGTIVPPTAIPVDVNYVPDPDYKTLIVGITFGTPREYDPGTGTIGPEIYTTDVGAYISAPGYVEWHWIPFVESTVKTNPYPVLAWASRERPFEFRLINNTTTPVWIEMTFWLAKFPRFVEGDPEDAFREYMKEIVRKVLG